MSNNLTNLALATATLSTNSILNINSLSSRSFFLTNFTNLNSLNVIGITKLNGITTCMSSLNVQGNIIDSGTAIKKIKL